MKIALLGYGTVGSAVAKVLLENQEIISARCGQILEPVIALARSKKPNSLVPVVNDINEILKRDDIDIYIELMGGIDEPFKLVSELLKRKKPVVSANKAMLAYHRYELETLAKDTFFGYEASVAGGIPIIRILNEGVSANNIISIKAILNGTSNFILSSMKQKNTSFAEALKEAQNLGYAEADPSFDINGDDAAHKLLILSSIAYGLKAKPEDILIEGISKISADDMYFADEFDLVIKLLGVAKAKNGKIDKVIGRDEEIKEVIKVLSRRKKNNVVLVGNGGCGKTAIVHHLANLIISGDIPSVLEGKEIVMLDIMALVSGTHFRGMFEERVKGGDR